MDVINNGLPLILETQELNQLLCENPASEELILIDLSTPELYELGHIPQAIFVNHKRLTCATPPAPGLLPELDQYSKCILREHPDESVRQFTGYTIIIKIVTQ